MRSLLLHAAALLFSTPSILCTVDARGDLLYFVNEHEFKRTFTEAKHFCASLGGTIPQEMSADDANYFSSLMKRNGHQWGVWLDVRKTSEGTYRWSKSGKEVQASDWAYGEPKCKLDLCFTGLDSDQPKLFSSIGGLARVLCVVNLAAVESSARLKASLASMHVSDQQAIQRILLLRPLEKKLEQLTQETRERFSMIEKKNQEGLVTLEAKLERVMRAFVHAGRSEQ